jgi:hypothetical protein
MFSIWTTEGRLDSHKRIVSEDELTRLKNKRIRQLQRLIPKAIDKNKQRRLESRLIYLK